MELYILSKQDLSILSICKLADYQINLDEETNAKSTFTLMKTNGLKKENYMVLNGLYRQFIFVIDDVQTEKESDVVTVTALDISNVFNRKVIEKNIDTMKNKSIEEFLANTISENFVNSDDTALNVNYIEIYWHTNTQGNVATNAENGLYNFHTFLINCRQYKNIYTDFKLENLGNPQTVEGKRISLEAKNRKIVDISLHGESTQNGTPTPDNKVDIENIEGNIEFKVEGKNLLYLQNVPNNTWFSMGEKQLMKIKQGTGIAPTPIPIDINLNVGDTVTISIHCISGKYINNTVKNSEVSLGLYHNGNNKSWQGEITLPKGQSLANKVFTATVAITEEVDSFMPFVYGNPTIEEDIDFYVQVEKNTEATDYEPYFSKDYVLPLSAPLRSLPNGVCDTIEEDGIHRRVGSKIITMNDIAKANTSYSNVVYAQITKPNNFIGYNNYNYNAVLCNKAESLKLPVGNFDNNKMIGKINTEAHKTMFWIGFPVGTTLDEMKSILDGTIIQYELSEEETVPYTEAQQEAWNKIESMKLYDGVNHISSDANMVLKYYPLEPVGLKFILRIDIENKQETTELIDTTLPEVTDYNKIYEADVTAKVQVYIREDGSEYNLYLKTDRTTTTNKDDPDRASGKIEVISVETADRAEEEALNVMKGNNYKHLVEFKIAKTSKLMDITELHIGRPIRIKTDDDIYDSYISAITLSDENFVYFKSGSLRITLIDKLKASNNSVGNKLDVTGGKILGNLNILDNAYFGKNGVAFGAPYDESVGGPLQLNGARIIESGSNSNGNYVKYADGTMICYMNKSYSNINITKAWGSMYETDPINLGNFPANFVNIPTVTATCTGGSTVFIEAIKPSKTSLGTSWFARPSSLENTETIISFIAIGKWK